MVARNTLANANATRDWRIYADFAQSLIGIARPLYVDEPFGVDLKETVYALDTTTIDLCLSVFPWAPFRSSQGGGQAAYAARSARQHPDLHPYQRRQDARGQHARSVGTRTRRLLHHGSGLHRLRTAVSLPPSRQLLRDPRQVQLKVQRRYSHPVDRSTGLICDQTIVLTGVYSPQDYPSPAAPHSLQGSQDRQDAGLSDQQLRLAGAHHHRALSLPLAGRTVLQMDQAASADQSLLRHLGERGQDANLDRGLGLRPGRHREKTAQTSRQPLSNPTNPESDPVVSQRSGVKGR